MIKFKHYKELFEIMEDSEKFQFSLISCDGGVTFSVAIINRDNITVAELEPEFIYTVNDLSDSILPRIFIGEDNKARIEAGIYSLTLPVAFKAVSKKCTRCRGSGTTYELVGTQLQHTTCKKCSGTGVDK